MGADPPPLDAAVPQALAPVSTATAAIRWTR